MTTSTLTENINFFVPAYSGHRYATNRVSPSTGSLQCTCGHSTFNVELKGTSFATCPACGTDRIGTKGKTNLNFNGYKVLEIGHKSFKVELEVMAFSRIEMTVKRRTVYILDMNFLTKTFDVTVNGKPAKTSNLGAYLERTFSKIPASGLLKELIKAEGTETSFWRCQFYARAGLSSALGDVLADILHTDAPGIEHGFI